MTTRLNQRGASHFILPVLAMAVVALVGVKVLTASHADQVSLTTSTTNSLSFGNNIAVEGPLNSSDPRVVQSSVPYTIMGYQQVSVLGPGQSLSYINGIKGNVQNCYDVYVQKPISGTVTATIDVANSNNTATYKLASTTGNNLRVICVNPGTGTDPGYNIKNASPLTQPIINVEVVSETLRW